MYEFMDPKFIHLISNKKNSNIHIKQLGEKGNKFLSLNIFTNKSIFIQ